LTAERGLVKEENKSFDGYYGYCDQCEWNGIPNQKIVIVYLGRRPTNEPGFIHKFETYDYSENGDKKTHQHIYDPQVIDRLVDVALSRNKVTAQ
jgi:hypothetical protein